MNRGRDLSTGTRSQGSLRELDWSYYDTMSLLSTTLSTRMFTQGLAGSSKTLYQTNMKNNGVIPTGERMTVHRIKILIANAADVASTVYANLCAILKQTTVEVKIAGSDSILTVTMQELLGESLLFPTTLVATYAAQRIPTPQFHGIFPLNRPIIFAEQESVEALVTHHVAPNAALNGTLIQISLNGILERKLS